MGNVKISYGIFKATSIYHNLGKRMKEVVSKWYMYMTTGTDVR